MDALFFEEAFQWSYFDLDQGDGGKGVECIRVRDYQSVFKPALQFCGNNATQSVDALAAQPLGSLSYVYLTLGSDTAIVDEVAVAAAKAAPHMRLVGYRELIDLAQQKRATLSSTRTRSANI